MRTYGDGCAIAQGLDLVGERWALLVVRELLLGLHREGTTIFLSSHLLAEIEQMSTRVGVLDRGRLVLQEDMSAIRATTGLVRVQTPDVGAAIARAEDKTAQMQARAGAIDELLASGALDDSSAINSGDDISRELEAMSSQSDVESELARLKSASHGGAIEGSSAAGALGAGTSGQPMQAGAEETPVQQPEEGRA